MSGATIETFTGKMFDILNPDIEMIDIRDIAHAGSQLCRFTGHTKHHYSIAQHEVIGSYLVPEENALEFLLHDAAESYVNDMSRPLKHMTPIGELYMPVEERIQVLIRKKFGLPKIQSEVIHTADTMMLLAERKQLMAGAKWDEKYFAGWKIDNTGGKMANVEIFEISPRQAEVAFLRRFRELTGEK